MTPEADLWNRRVKYTVQRPSAFAGNIFKTQGDYRLSPDVSFELTVKR